MIQCLTLRRQVVTTARRRRGRSRVNRTGKDACGHARDQRRIATPPDCTCAKAIDNVFVEDHCGYVLVCIGRQAFDTINWVAFLRRCGCSAAPLASIQIRWKAKRSRAACNRLRQAQSPWPRLLVAEAMSFPSSCACDVGAQHTHHVHYLLDQHADKYHAGAQHESYLIHQNLEGCISPILGESRCGRQWSRAQIFLVRIHNACLSIAFCHPAGRWNVREMQSFGGQPLSTG